MFSHWWWQSTEQLPREGTESSSLETFQTHHEFLYHLLEVTLPWQEGCSRWYPEVPFNWKNSVILLVCDLTWQKRYHRQVSWRRDHFQAQVGIFTLKIAFWCQHQWHWQCFSYAFLLPVVYTVILRLWVFCESVLCLWRHQSCVSDFPACKLESTRVGGSHHCMPSGRLSGERELKKGPN